MFNSCVYACTTPVRKTYTLLQSSLNCGYWTIIIIIYSGYTHFTEVFFRRSCKCHVQYSNNTIRYDQTIRSRYGTIIAIITIIAWKQHCQLGQREVAEICLLIRHLTNSEFGSCMPAIFIISRIACLYINTPIHN